MTAEKYLLALNCTKFVGLLRDNGLSYLVQSTNESYTILAPRDEVLADWQEEWARLPSSGSSEMKTLLQYHFIDAFYKPDDLHDSSLVQTMLKPNKLKGQSQRLEVFKTPTEEGKLISFGNANAQGKPSEHFFGDLISVSDPINAVVIGPSIIYPVSQPLEPPSDVLQTAMTDLRLSTFVASVYAAGLDKRLKRAPATTLLAPVNQAFDDLGLVMSYLLLPSSLSELRSVVRYHFLDEVIYLNDLQQGDSLHRSLEGSDVNTDRSGNSITLRGPTINGYPASGQTTPTNLTSGDLLTATGVTHVVDQVLLPVSVHISNRKLLQGAKAETMAHLIKLANMSWILDGDSATLSTAKKNPSVLEQTYTLLAPSDHAFSRVNLTFYENNLPALRELIKLHIIPLDAQRKLKHQTESAGHPLSLQDGLQVDTLLSRRRGGTSRYGTLAFRLLGDSYLVGIKGARGTLANDWAHVTGFGRATPRLSGMEELRKGGREAPLLVHGGGVLSVSS